MDTVSSIPILHSTYLNDTGKWPHQESLNIIFQERQVINFLTDLKQVLMQIIQKVNQRDIVIHLTNTERLLTVHGQIQLSWQTTDPTLTMSSSAFNWRDVYTVNAAPYATYQMVILTLKANVFYIYTMNILMDIGC